MTRAALKSGVEISLGNEDLPHQRLARNIFNVAPGSRPGEEEAPYNPCSDIHSKEWWASQSQAPSYLLPELSASLASASSLENGIPEEVMTAWPAPIMPAALKNPETRPCELYLQGQLPLRTKQTLRSSPGLPGLMGPQNHSHGTQPSPTPRLHCPDVLPGAEQHCTSWS